MFDTSIFYCITIDSMDALCYYISNSLACIGITNFRFLTLFIGDKARKYTVMKFLRSSTGIYEFNKNKTNTSFIYCRSDDCYKFVSLQFYCEY